MDGAKVLLGRASPAKKRQLKTHFFTLVVNGDQLDAIIY
jgi:hypothetical protein